MIERVCERWLALLHRRRVVTWERRTDAATVLTVVNAWPEPEFPMRAAFVRRSVDGLAAAQVRTDVLYVRGYRGTFVYLLGASAMLSLAVARRGRYRLVHCHSGWSALAGRWYLGAPVLASYWGTDILGVSNAHGQRVGTARYRVKFTLLSNLVRFHATLMTATTTKTVEMERRLPRRVRRRNRVIPDGVDLSRFVPADRAAARRALGWPLDEVTVITVGRVDPLKRLGLAEAASALAARDLPGLRWRQISELPADSMPDCYNAADVLLHTSASEGSPNAVKEAMACNLPVVATASGDIPELLDGVRPSTVCDGHPATLARAIVEVLRDGRRSNGREHVSRLSLEVVTERTLSLYRELGGL